MADLLDVGSSLLNFFGSRDAQAKAIDAQQRINQQNLQMSKFMAENSVQMRKQDAEAAGIHPVFALGAPTMSFAPAQVGAAGQPINHFEHLAKGMRDLGQTMTSAPGSQAAPNSYSVQAASLDLENRRLQNEILRNKVVEGRAQVGASPPVGNFVVPESKKIDENPPLMLGGTRWGTSEKTSPMKSWEDRYGDEGPVASTLPLLILNEDFSKNYPVDSWPGHVKRWGMSEINKILQNSDFSGFRRLMRSVPLIPERR